MGDMTETDPPPFPRMFEGLNTLMVTSSRDWSGYAPDAWLYGVFVGWDCEDEHEVHDDSCGGNAVMGELAAEHGWSEETVARLRRYRAAVRAEAERGEQP